MSKKMPVWELSENYKGIDDPNFENCWFESTQYSDTKIGQDIFLELLERIVLKK